MGEPLLAKQSTILFAKHVRHWVFFGCLLVAGCCMLNAVHFAFWVFITYLYDCGFGFGCSMLYVIIINGTLAHGNEKLGIFRNEDYGAWWMVNGAWCMVHGAWCMVHGAWCMMQCQYQHQHATAFEIEILKWKLKLELEFGFRLLGLWFEWRMVVVKVMAVVVVIILMKCILHHHNNRTIQYDSPLCGLSLGLLILPLVLRIG